MNIGRGSTSHVAVSFQQVNSTSASTGSVRAAAEPGSSTGGRSTARPSLWDTFGSTLSLQQEAENGRVLKTIREWITNDVSSDSGRGRCTENALLIFAVSPTRQEYQYYRRSWNEEARRPAFERSPNQENIINQLVAGLFGGGRREEARERATVPRPPASRTVEPQPSTSGPALWCCGEYLINTYILRKHQKKRGCDPTNGRLRRFGVSAFSMKTREMCLTIFFFAATTSNTQGMTPEVITIADEEQEMAEMHNVPVRTDEHQILINIRRTL